MSFSPSDRDNPFEAPRASIGGHVYDGDIGDNGEAEVTRRTYLNHEASVKALGSLQYLGAAFCLVLTVVCFLAAAGVFEMGNTRPAMSPDQTRVFFAIIGGAFLVGFLLYAGFGYGLRNLQVWARWVMIVLTSLSLLLTVAQLVLLGATNPALAGGALARSAIPSLITGYFLYLAASAKGAVVFSREYKEVIRKTPHIKYRTSIIVKVLVGFLIFVILLGLLAFIFSPRR